MSDNSFELPLPHEKSASKFILDALNAAESSDSTEPDEAQLELAPVDEPEETAPAEEAATEAPEVPEPSSSPEIELPEGQKYFRVGEAAELMKVEPHVLRYWEGEFQGIRPLKSRSGQRTYTRRDMEIFLKVRHLLYVDKFSVKGAKQKMREARAQQKHAPAQVDRAVLRHMAQELRNLIQLARNSPGLG